MSYKVLLAKTEHAEVFSIYRFATAEEAQKYIDWIFRDLPRTASILLCDEPINITLDAQMHWRKL